MMSEVGEWITIQHSGDGCPVSHSGDWSLGSAAISLSRSSDGVLKGWLRFSAVGSRLVGTLAASLGLCEQGDSGLLLVWLPIVFHSKTSGNNLVVGHMT
jgi:hypothetical protein